MRLPRIAVAMTALALASPASAHCDGIDGPVVKAAQFALASGNPAPVLIWVQPGDEAVIRAAFADALEVRKLNPKARELADRYFFETLVRLHRAGEGAPYTGLKPAGRDLGPVIPLADQAVASGSDEALAQLLTSEAAKGVHARFRDLQSKRKFRSADLAAGRAYIESYVSFVHYVEALHKAIEASAPGHFAEGTDAAAHHDE